jgi:formylglycine-generating enzyme required for sulfatase activity
VQRDRQQAEGHRPGLVRRLRADAADHRHDDRRAHRAAAASAAGRGRGGAQTDAPAQCRNNAQDIGETDVDCGGTLCPKCIDGKKCVAGTDCVGGFCDAVTQTCKTPTCSDNQLNGAETDIDCGGPNCQRCTVGRKCAVGGDCQSGACANGLCVCPAGMVVIPTNQALGGSYCMEATEVTLGDYNAFVVANQPVRFQPPGCNELTDGGPPQNLTYVPSGDWPPSAGQLSNPVHYVDWCDAYAYCKWKGRQLCGNIKGGTNPQSLASSIANSAWFNACSAQGQNTYPYSGDFDALACNGGTLDGGPVGVAPSTAAGRCQGGFVGLYHMSGNVAEWEDSCPQSGTDAGPAPSASDMCLVRGGSYASNNDSAALACDAGRTVQRIPTNNADLADVGFRCCVY